MLPELEIEYLDYRFTAALEKRESGRVAVVDWQLDSVSRSKMLAWAVFARFLKRNDFADEDDARPYRRLAGAAGQPAGRAARRNPGGEGGRSRCCRWYRRCGRQRFFSRRNRQRSRLDRHDCRMVHGRPGVAPGSRHFKTSGFDRETSFRENSERKALIHGKTASRRFDNACAIPETGARFKTRRYESKNPDSKHEKKNAADCRRDRRRTTRRCRAPTVTCCTRHRACGLSG